MERVWDGGMWMWVWVGKRRVDDVGYFFGAAVVGLWRRSLVGSPALKKE